MSLALVAGYGPRLGGYSCWGWLFSGFGFHEPMQLDTQQMLHTHVVFTLVLAHLFLLADDGLYHESSIPPWILFLNVVV